MKDKSRKELNNGINAKSVLLTLLPYALMMLIALLIMLVLGAMLYW